MGSKKTLPDYSLITDGVMTGTNTLSSVPTFIVNLDNVGLDIGWTGTSVGLITIECSVDGTTYRSLTFDPPITQPAGAAGGYLVSLNQLPFKFIKVSYANASGVGVFNAKIIGKDLN